MNRLELVRKIMPWIDWRSYMGSIALMKLAEELSDE
jgi:hypothetical protein